MAATLMWEVVPETDPSGQKTTTVQRASVPGGWLLRDAAARGSLVFLPDPTHAWGAPSTRGREIDFSEIE